MKKYVLLNDKMVEEIAQNLNYKVLVKLIHLTTPYNTTVFKDYEYPSGHLYAILVYLTGEQRQYYYQGLLKLENLFQNSQSLLYVYWSQYCQITIYQNKNIDTSILHLVHLGILGQYLDNFDELNQYYNYLHVKSINEQLHTFTVYEGSGAKIRIILDLKCVLKLF
ncbi:unnamed protein product (macronuclear) [Paramecium tetraurelia]|uniref:Uncharacterized protein n=1 Tax=Paramecium tetraurelia TaxID=5888 RepID=A0D8J2_PARTE|nr:uncharacterized protein GSPATT00014305001 [Paramecium tetraurelia]CAK79359.1 unnamed protein product [Paramecium tetraurelia]|eukprot:XP_001446756.1 hypothetical protein (macronuclear) [Paramecium tetraurelia strain d4-2]